jgi:splicing factor U2AF subunit
MLNMATADDLNDDVDYGYLYEDVKEECSNYSEVEDLRIPQPVKKVNLKGLLQKADRLRPKMPVRLDEPAGVGRVYVKYVSPRVQLLLSVLVAWLVGRLLVGLLYSLAVLVHYHMISYINMPDLRV